MFWKFLPSALIILLSIWIFCLQTRNAGRLLIALVILSGGFTMVKEVLEYRAGRPCPRLILQQIHSSYDKNPPSAAVFSLIIRNVGDAEASSVSVRTTAYCDGKVSLENDKTLDVNIERDRTVGIDLSAKGPTFESAFSGKSELKVTMDFAWSDVFGRTYTNSESARYDPNQDSPVFNPSWILLGK